MNSINFNNQGFSSYNVHQKPNNCEAKPYIKSNQFPHIENTQRVSFKGVFDFFRKKKKILNPIIEKTEAVFYQSAKPALNPEEVKQAFQQRLLNKGFDEELSQKILKTCTTKEGVFNRDHCQRCITMSNLGFEKTAIPEILLSAKSPSNKLSVPTYYKAIDLHNSGVEDVFIPKVIEEFKLVNGIFNDASYLKFERIHAMALRSQNLKKPAFANKSVQELNEFFYSNISKINNAADLIGKETLIYTFNLSPAVFEDVLSRSEYLSKSLNHKLKVQLNSKMNPRPYSQQLNNGPYEIKKPEAQEIVSYQDRLVLLKKVFELEKSAASYNRKNVDTSIYKLLNNLPY